MPQDPKLLQNGSLKITIKALTEHAAFSRLWILPPGANNWEDPRDVADGSKKISDNTTYDVQHGTYLGWNLSVGTTAGATDYVVTFTLEQNGQVITDGVLDIQGKTDSSGEDVDIDRVRLR